MSFFITHKKLLLRLLIAAVLTALLLFMLTVLIAHCFDNDPAAPLCDKVGMFAFIFYPGFLISGLVVWMFSLSNSSAAIMHLVGIYVWIYVLIFVIQHTYHLVRTRLTSA